MRWFQSALLACCFGLAPSGAARAESGIIQVDMQLVLAVDISFSISRDEQDIQRRGYVAAFRDPTVIGAITSGYRGRIAVTLMEWAGAGMQTQIVPWRVISDDRSARDFASELAQAEVHRSGRTSLSQALLAAGALLSNSPFVSNRQVVDISSDGLNNAGARVDRARDRLVYRGITINGLPLMAGTATGPASDLDVYFADCVIGGLGAFMQPVTRWRDFGPSLKKKLIVEIAGPTPAPGRARIYLAAETVAPATARMDCLTGEKRNLQNYIRRLEGMTGGNAERWRPREKDWPLPK